MKSSLFARYGCAVALLCLTAVPAFSAAGPENAVLQYELKISQGARPATKIVRKIWKKGDKYRLELITSKGTQVTLGGPRGSYTILEDGKEATHAPKPATTEKGLWAGLFGDTAAMRKSKKLGTETLFGRPTEIFEQKLDGPATGVAPGVKGTSKIWLAPGLPMPFKSVSKFAPNMKSEMVLKSIKLDAALPDSLFELPKNVSVRTDPMLPGMLPASKLPKRAWYRK